MVDTEVAVARPERWDAPFGDDMRDADVDRLLAVEPFRSIDADTVSADAAAARHPAERRPHSAIFLRRHHRPRGRLRQQRVLDLARPRARRALGTIGGNSGPPAVAEARLVGDAIARAAALAAARSAQVMSAPSKRADTATAATSQPAHASRRACSCRTCRGCWTQTEHRGARSRRDLRRTRGADAQPAHPPRCLPKATWRLVEIRWQGLRDLMRRTDALAAAHRAALPRKQPARPSARDAAAGRLAAGACWQPSPTRRSSKATASSIGTQRTRPPSAAARATRSSMSR